MAPESITKTVRQNSMQAAQWKQEMKAEETGSARRMLCQYFIHGRWKDSMGEGVKKSRGPGFISHNDEQSHPQSTWGFCLEQM